MDPDKGTELTAQAPEVCRILSLDGGGAKGFYTLGVLKELEALVGQPLCERFRLIFGTSTGAIIAALLALGYSVDAVHALYKAHVPTIMQQCNACGRSEALAHLAKTVFGDRKFTDVKTGIGIVATHWTHEKPMIFKSGVEQAHGRQGTFVPGFGCTIADAVRASCSAYPFFERTTLKTNKGEVELLDGGYCANNPTLYAIADATLALKAAPSDIRVVSIGVGVYPEPRRWRRWFWKRFVSVQLLQKTLNVNTLSMEQLRMVLFGNIETVRVNDEFSHPEMATDLMEHDLVKLDRLYQRGSESFANHEASLRHLMDVPLYSNTKTGAK
jgi:predicted acylesterase/phospholipase RssA